MVENYLLFITVLILGGILGLLANYLADVLPAGRFLKTPVCDCGEERTWTNYLLWQACTGCQRKRSIRGVIVQVALPAAAGWMWLAPPHRLGFWVGLILMVYFTVVGVIDLEYRVILHPVSLFGAILGTIIGVWLHGWWVTLLGGAAGFGIMLILFYAGEGFGRLVSKIRKQEVNEVALGFGDVNLNGVLGLIMGWPGIAGGLFLAVMIAGVFSLGYILINVITRKYHPLQAIPYAPFLILGAVGLLYFT